MNKTITELKSESLSALAGNWGMAVGTFLLLTLISSAASSVGFIPVVGAIAVMFITGAIMGGMIIFSFNLLKGSAILEDGFKGFSDFMRLGSSYFVMNLFIFLWSLLFIIPGIIKSFSYAMTMYILIDEPETEMMDAITKSREMMDGHKFRYFVLQLSFIGWALLCALFTLGIGFLWLTPYMQLTMAGFYNDLKPTVKSIDEMPLIMNEM